MDFNLNADQQAFADSARALFADFCSDEQLRAHDSGSEPFMRALWPQCIANGLHGVLIGEAQGGLGLGMTELLAVLQEQGRALALVPLWEHQLAAAAVQRFAPSLTDAAAARVKEIMARAEKPYAGLRVGVKNGGCAGSEYIIEYAETANPLDEVVEDHGVTILIEPKAVLFLIGAEIDYEVSRLSSKFVFRNPNETDACGCGESVTIQPAAEV